MYRVYADEFLLHDDRLEDYKVISPRLELELNKTGSFEFSMYPDHIYYTKIAKIKTIITVYQDSKLLFRGRVLNEEIGFYNEKKIQCEGELSFLLDSIQRPYDFTGSVLEYFTQLITNHNSQVETAKQFAIGNVTVTDPNDYIVRSNIDPVNTWDELNNKLINNLGGYIQVRHDGGANIIDYLTDFNKLATQTVEFGENLIDLKKIQQADEIATALIPLGAKLKNEEEQETDQRLTIESVNSGLDYISDSDAVGEYGWIYETATWDDVTDASNLLTKGKAYLADRVKGIESIELSAADLSKIGKAVDTFNIGTYVHVISKPHGIDKLFLVNRLSLLLMEPASNTLTLGTVQNGFSAVLGGLSNKQGELLQRIESVAKNATEAVYDVERNVESSISIAEENITATVSDKFYLKNETDSLISEVSSSLEQTAEGFDFQFTEFSAALADLVAGTDSEFELIKRYIRFIDGSIWLGEVGNELELQISNDRISFFQGGAEVAYFSNNRLYVTDGQFINSLQLGDFAFIPRNNGNLSFKKLDSSTGSN